MRSHACLRAAGPPALRCHCHCQALATAAQMRACRTPTHANDAAKNFVFRTAWKLAQAKGHDRDISVVMRHPKYTVIYVQAQHTGHIF